MIGADGITSERNGGGASFAGMEIACAPGADGRAGNPDDAEHPITGRHVACCGSGDPLRCLQADRAGMDPVKRGMIVDGAAIMRAQDRMGVQDQSQMVVMDNL